MRHARFTFWLFVAIIACEPPRSALAYDQAALGAFAMAFSAAKEAEATCPHTHPEMERLQVLDVATKLKNSASDNAALVEAFDNWKKFFQKGISEKGSAEWCRGILMLFGPNGKVPVIRVENE